jgi:hypothetical protein
VLSIDLNVGKGLKLFPSIGSGNLTLDLEEIYSSSEEILDSDYILFERPSTGDTNYVFSVAAENMLPSTLNGDHFFSGTINLNELNVVDNVIRLQYGVATTENDSGLILDTTTSSKVKFTYNTAKSAWFSNKNLGLDSAYSFVSNSTSKDAYFRYATSGSQYDVILELAMGLSSTSVDDKSWLIEARNYLRKLDFVYRNSYTTDLDRTIFSAQLDDDYGYNSTFIITDKIQIGNVAGSTTNFKAVTNYSSNIIPISNSYGVLDKGWTNRYVTSNYTSISVGDIVSIYDHTSGNAMVVKENLSTTSGDENDTHPLGIVEKISGGVAYIVMLGEFKLTSTPSPAFVTGLTYYLTNGSPNYTATKPSSGMIKPLFIATGNDSGIIFPMSSGLLSYGRISVGTAGESGYIVGSGQSVYSSSTNGGVTFKAGQGITLQTDNTTKTVTIRAITQGNEPGYSNIRTTFDNKLLQAVTPSDTLSIGGIGNIIVTGDNTTNEDHVYIRGKYFSTVGITSDDTNEETDTFIASYDDTITFYGGTGIKLSRYSPGSNAIKIVATGDIAQSVIGDYSLSLRKLEKQTKNSILYTKGTSTYEQIRALQASGSNGSFLTAGTNAELSWTAPFPTVTTFIASKTLNTGGGETVYNGNNNRFWGISTYNSSSTYKDTAYFIQNTFGGIQNRVQISLIEGDGIQLSVIKNPTDPAWTGAPSIKITNTATGTQFNNFYIEDTRELLVADSTGRLNLITPVNSPIRLDGDTTAQNLYFDIRNNSITNSHLKDMADNTVKIGRGNTDPSSPEDLLINSNSVLGRLTGDLQSLSRSNLLTLLQFSGSSFFNEVVGDSGYTTSSDSETLTIIGGAGITVDVDTNNNVVITNTLPESGMDMGINVIGNRTYDGSSYYYSNVKSGVTKLYFDDNNDTADFSSRADIKANIYSISGDSLKGAIQLSINWSHIGVIGSTFTNTIGSGPGILYGGINSDSFQFETRFAQTGSSSSGYLPYINQTDEDPFGKLYYLTSDSEVYTEQDGELLDYALIGFNPTGALVKTTNYCRLVDTDVIGLAVYQESVNTFNIKLDPDYTNFQAKNFVATSGGYGSGRSAMFLEPTIGKQIAFMTLNSPTAFSSLMYIDFGSDAIIDPFERGPQLPFGFETLSDTRITVKTFSSDWYSLSQSKICMPTIMLGLGPTSSLATSSTGYLVSNDSATGAVVLTNYNLNTSGSKSIAKDRSSRLSLSVLNVDSESNNAYASIKTTGTLAHTYSTTTDVVDRFTMSSNSVKSIKYLVQAISSTNQVFTSEFIVQVSTYSAGSCKYIQYASVSQDGGFTLDITAELSGTTVSVKHNGSSISASISLVKVIKQEI